MEEFKGEIWKPIICDGIDYSGHYEASNLGRIRSLKNGIKILKHSINRGGYLQVILSLNNIKKFASVHKLVTSSFGIISGNGYVIDHINSNVKDNRLSNLQLLSIRANSSKERTIKSNLPCGVSREKAKTLKNLFTSRIREGNKQYFLGIYKTIQSASYAYQLALSAHEKGFELEKIFKVVDDYRVLIGLKPIKRKI